MDYIIKNRPKTKLPICVWQIGKSFRQEKQGLSSNKMRYNEYGPVLEIAFGLDRLVNLKMKKFL